MSAMGRIEKGYTVHWVMDFQGKAKSRKFGSVVGKGMKTKEDYAGSGSLRSKAGKNGMLAILG